MAFATYAKDQEDDAYERVSDWFHSSRLGEANRVTWLYRGEGFEAVTVMDRDELGKL